MFNIARSINCSSIYLENHFDNNYLYKDSQYFFSYICNIHVLKKY